MHASQFTTLTYVVIGAAQPGHRNGPGPKRDFFARPKQDTACDLARGLARLQDTA
jgi:hypothetical protein